MHKTIIAVIKDYNRASKNCYELLQGDAYEAYDSWSATRAGLWNELMALTDSGVELQYCEDEPYITVYGYIYNVACVIIDEF